MKNPQAESHEPVAWIVTVHTHGGYRDFLMVIQIYNPTANQRLTGRGTRPLEIAWQSQL